MKKITILSTCILLSIAAMCQPPKGDANPGDKYGEIKTTEGAVDIAQIPAELEKKSSITTKVIAKVLDVCPNKGCWLTLAINDSTEAFVKMKDYAFFAPLAIKGKTIVMDGKASIKTISVEELKHYAEDAKKSQEEIDAIKEPKNEIRFLASGIQVVQ
ncbi:MAG: DUF4920 domain-containing protein [Bacteroidota bacterium]